MLGGHLYRTQMGDLIVAASGMDAMLVIAEWRERNGLPEVALGVRQIPDEAEGYVTRSAGEFARAVERGVYTRNDDGGLG